MLLITIESQFLETIQNKTIIKNFKKKCFKIIFKVKPISIMINEEDLICKI